MSGKLLFQLGLIFRLSFLEGGELVYFRHLIRQSCAQGFVFCFELCIQALDGCQRDTICIDHRDVLVVISERKGGIEILSHRPDVLFAAQAELQSARAPAAVQRLQTWVALHPRDATAWQLLSSAYTAQGQTLRAIRADAEAQVAWLDYAAAMDRFKAAQELARKGGAGNDHFEASIIDTRTRQVELLLREQALER